MCTCIYIYIHTYLCVCANKLNGFQGPQHDHLRNALNHRSRGALNHLEACSPTEAHRFHLPSGYFNIAMLNMAPFKMVISDLTTYET